jgi:hypothetical protein
MVGVPVGRDIRTGATVCSDPVNWFRRAGLIANPSMVVLGIPGVGKSKLVGRIATGLASQGVDPIIPGDLKPDHADMTLALGGRVVQLGRGQGCLNVLDPGAAMTAAHRLTGDARRKLMADSLGRRLNMVSALVALNRRAVVTDVEEALVAAALSVLDDRFQPGQATLVDLVGVLEAGPEPVRRLTLDRGDDERYRAAVHGLQSSIGALLQGAMGDSFAHQTTTPMVLDGPLDVDISGIGASDEKLQAAVMLACWGEAFGAIAAAQALADAGLERQRLFFIVLDELWRVLRAGPGLVDRVDALTRLNRQEGVGMALVFHTLKDLVSLPTEEDRMKAKGFAERAGYLAIAGVPAAELALLEQVVSLTRPEGALLTSWADPPSWDTEHQRELEPPGRGRFLLKVGGRPGIPVQMTLVGPELGIHDTNKKWHG